MTSAAPTSPVPSLRHCAARRVLHTQAPEAIVSSWGVGTTDVTIWECPVTGMRFRDLPSTQALEGFYESSYHERMTGGANGPERRRAYQKENEIRVEDLRRYVKQGSVLDIGCSCGDFAHALASAGFEAHGLDISPDACAEARRLLGDQNVYCEPIEQLASRMAERFAAVTLMDVIEHCRDVESFLNAIHAVLQPGGILFLRTPTLRSPFHLLGSLSFRLSLGLYKDALFKLYHAEHLYFFNEVSIRRLLDDCGFDTLEIAADPLCWDNFRTAELNQGKLGNLILATTYFAGRALNRGHGMKVIARSRVRARPGDPVGVPGSHTGRGLETER